MRNCLAKVIESRKSIKNIEELVLNQKESFMIGNISKVEKTEANDKRIILSGNM